MISVVMPNWNRGDALTMAARSCLDQVDIEMELIIIDDASTDNSLEQAKRIRDEATIPVRILETHESLTRNICLTANIGFVKAHGDYIVLNPSDTIQVMETNFKNDLTAMRNGKVWADPYLLYLSTWKRKKIAQAGACFRKEDLHRVTGFDEHMKGWGSNEPDLVDRLKRTGVVRVQSTARVLHIDLKIGGPPERRAPEGAHRIHQSNYVNNVTAPNKTWGEHPKLEEIK